MIKVTVKSNEDEKILEAGRGEGLRDVLERNGILVPLPCAGEGRCGKCRVRFLDGMTVPDGRERELIDERELERGERLLCRSFPEGDCRIEVTGVGNPEEMKILTVKEGGPVADSEEDESEKTCGIAVDLGTTTIAATLLVRNKGTVGVVKSSSTVNHQYVYGADVISRISSAQDSGCAVKMKALVCEDVFSLVKELLQISDTDKMSASDIGFIAIAGNTTMLHLLTGKTTAGLGKYPYEPVSLELETLDGSLFDESLRGVRVDILPGISAFVGADIVAGLFYLKGTGEENFIMLDLGTNGEIAFFDGERIYAASTAAGPVFEAGGISCGMASMKGAICSADVETEGSGHAVFKVTYKTIEGAEPMGVCGTGLMELVSGFVSAGVIDHTGLIEDKYFDGGIPVTEDGNIRLTQKDIRNFQLAKAAVYSGISTLLKGRLPERVFLSGGFGNALNCGRIRNLLLYPGELDDRIETSGNTSLKGCAGYVSAHLMGKDRGEAAEKEIRRIPAMAEVTELSDSEVFDGMFLKAMNF